MKLVFLILLVTLNACDANPVGSRPDGDAEAYGVTDLALYDLPESPSDETVIRWVYSNRTNMAVWIIDCRGPRPELQKLVEGAWVYAIAGPRLDCLSAFRIEPGDQYRGEYEIRHDAIDLEPASGVYRFLWPQIVWNFETRTSTSPFGDLLPESRRVSNRFQLRD